jgi:membrane protease YdiL (CAAX protease family)
VLTIKRLFFGTAWFILFFVGACIAVSFHLRRVTGDADLASEAAGVAIRAFMDAYVLHLFAGAFVLAVAGTITGILPGTRKPALVARAGGELVGDGQPATPARAFGIREGIVAFVAFAAVQFAVFFALGIVAVADVGLRASPIVLNARIQELLPTGLLLTYAAVGLFLFKLFRGYARRPDWPAIKDSFALAGGSAPQNVVGLACGVALGAAYTLLAPLLADPTLAGPSASGAMVETPTGFFAWAIAAVLLAPPTEELLFRSLMIRSFAAKLSLPVAAFVSAALFWLVHVPESMNYWPAGIAIALMAILVTGLRLSTRALGPAIVCHAGYNLAIAGLILRGFEG